jgi:hypothetical protein
MKNVLIFVVVAVILPFTMNFAAYFGYISGYTINTFSESSFKNQYYNDIYKYRVLSSHAIVELNHLLENGNYKSSYGKLSRQLQFLDKNATVSFYLAYFIWNTLFLILSSIAFYFLLLKVLKLEIITIIVATLIFNFLIVFTQYVVVPYDNFSYFFEILFIIFVFYNPTKTLPASNLAPTPTLPTREGVRKGLVFKPSLVGRVGVGSEFLAGRVCVGWLVLPLLMIISTLNRESSAVSLAFLAAILFYHHKNDYKKWIKILLPSVLAFLIAYFGMRYYLGFDGSALQTDTMIGNIKSPYSLIGLLFCICTTFIVFATGNSLTDRINKYFLIFSIPYILSCFITGIMVEYRLWVPMLIGMIVINLKYGYNNASYINL